MENGEWSVDTRDCQLYVLYAFIPGRLMADNVLVASEVIHYLNRKGDGCIGWCALKLDMAKVYDKMEWFSLRGIMIAMGFDMDYFIDLIMLCVSTVKNRVLINGNLSEVITPTRGLREGGDPYHLISLFYVQRIFPSLSIVQFCKVNSHLVRF